MRAPLSAATGPSSSRWPESMAVWAEQGAAEVGWEQTPPFSALFVLLHHVGAGREPRSCPASPSKGQGALFPLFCRS